MLTEKDLTAMCQKICGSVGYEFNIPVKINKRLTRTLGRVCALKYANGRVVNEKMEFSYNFLSHAALPSIEDVVAHECAHFLVVEETHEHHGHDFVFKAMCARIGCTNDGTVCNNLTLNTQEAEYYKYHVFCKNCHKIVGKYHRAGKLVQHPELCSCRCGGELYVIKNF